ncbi:Rhodanese-like domain-containing protein [Umbelopsis sp. PMI_123]|nr:Rhodanese-like domain-containing protein [Umbelopsis sp. PMI_123]
MSINITKGNSNVKILDGSWHMPNTQRDPYKEYLEKHIPGARFFGIDDIKDHSSDLPHMLPSKDDFASAVGKLGISNNDHVVIYDSIGVISACRVYWTFRIFGHQKVSVLNGGLPKWIAEGRPVESGEPKPISPVEYKVTDVNDQLVRDYDTIINNVKKVKNGDNGFLVADARSHARFTGEAAEPRASLSSGHMPGSISMPFQELMSGTEFLSDEVLKAKWSGKISDLKQEIVASCGSGITASVLYFTLERIGAQNISVYDGSWTEYAGRKESIIEKD